LNLSEAVFFGPLVFQQLKNPHLASLVRLIYYGYRMKEIAEYLGVHYATVSRAVMRIEQEQQKK
jgi:DNA-binding MarR family transcriptional regulator